MCIMRQSKSETCAVLLETLLLDNSTGKERQEGRRAGRERKREGKRDWTPNISFKDLSPMT